jgi:hypothetical protein
MPATSVDEILPAKLLLIDSNQEAGVEPARSYVVPPAFASDHGKGRQDNFGRDVSLLEM